MNAIERLREILPLLFSPTHEDEAFQEGADALAAVDALYQALAAVDALYQAAKDVNGMFPPRTRFGMTPELIALAAAVRRVEGEA